MLKSERLQKIIELVNRDKTVSTQELVEQLGISDMTVRRYLAELDHDNKILRVHGGAQSIDYSSNNIELSHAEKMKHNKDEKVKIARAAADLVQEGDTIFLGPGTTLQLMAGFLIGKNIQVVTNSMAVFELLKLTSIDLVLAAGHYHKLTNTFYGTMTNRVLEHIRADKAFFSVNGLYHLKALNHNIEDGETQRLALDNAHQRFLLTDHSKLNKNDIYEFYNLEQVDAMIVDEQVAPSALEYYQQHLKVIIA